MIERLIRLLIYIIGRLQVMFNTPVSTVEYPKINEWLTQVEKEMRVTLAQRLAEAVKDVRQFKEGTIDQPAFMSWCDKYEAQIVVLAAQIMWSEDVEGALQATSSSSDGSLAPLQRVLGHFLIHFYFVLTSS